MSVPLKLGSAPRPPRRDWIYLLVILALAVVAGMSLWPGRGPAVTFDVHEGFTAHRIARNLQEAGIVRHRFPVLAWVRLRNAAHRIHTGRYVIPRGRSAFWIVDDLIDGRTRKTRVTIPEGWAAWQIAERMEAEGVCLAEPFRKHVREKKLEGYLFPATYDFEFAVPVAAVAGRLRNRFEQVWTSEMEARAKEIGLTRHEVVTLASIVEREVRVRDEAPMISAVYHNRLRTGMKLDADPTVQYALGGWKTRLTYADYRNTDSPYNTYRNAGLPPGPICSPGLESLRAALWPAQSNALYFVASEDGRHSFSATYREHVNKVNRRNRQRRNKK